MRAIACVALLAMVGSLGCRPAAEQAPVAPVTLETEDIGGPVDESVTTNFDVQAASMTDNVGSKLPADFPAGVPLYRGSSVINYGPGEAGRRFVDLSVPAQVSAVESRYNSVLESAGWRAGEAGQFVRRGETIVVTYRQGTPGTWVRIEYSAAG